MKKAGKILIGVLSVGALIGTGYAAWHINNGFVSTESGNVDVSVNDMIINSFAKVVVEETDTPKGITFDGGLNEDLHLSYKVTAEKTNSKDTKDPYDLSLYENVAKEYIPDLKVTVKAVKKEGSTPLTTEELANVNKYINLPEEQTFSYTDWLSNKEGKNIALDFSWSKATFNGQNPENYFKENPSETAETTIQDMINTLKPVTFKVHFDVGQHTFTEPDKSGTITIPEIANSTLTIDGKQETSITAGEHEISIALEEGKQIKDNKLTVIENGTRKDVTLSETRIRATGKVYTCTYTFLKDATYSFEYTVENIPPRQVTLTEGTHTHVNLTTTAGEAIDFTAKHDVGSTFEFKATALEGYKLESVKHNDTILEAKGDVYSFKVVDGTNTISATATEIPVVVEKFKVTLDTASSEGATLTTVEGTNLDLNAEYEKGTELKFKVKFDETQYKLTEVTNNGTKLTDTEGVYTITIGETNSIKVTLEKVEAPVETYDKISEVLKAEDGKKVKVKGKIVAYANSSLVLQDETGFIETRPAQKVNYEIGKVAIVTGNKGVFANSGAIQINNANVTVLDETSEIQLPTEAITVDAGFFEGKTVDELKTTHTYIEAEGQFIDDGKYKNLILNGTDKKISVKTSRTDFVNDREYKIKGFASGFSGTSFLNVFIIEAEILPYKNVESVTIKDGETLELIEGQSKKINVEVLPTTSNPNVTYEVTEGNDFVEVTPEGEVKALKPGTAIITVKSTADPSKLDTISVVVTKKPDVGGEVVTKKFVHTFATGEIKTTGGDITLNGLTWNYNKATFIGFDNSSGRGVQIGKSKAGQKTPWKISTTFPCEVSVKSYSINLSVASSGKANYEINFGTISDKGTFNNTSAQDYSNTTTGLDEKTNNFEIILTSDVDKAMYIKSIAFEIDVPVEYADQFNF